MKYRKLYEYGRDFLTEGDVPDSDIDARLLLEYVTGCSRSTLLIDADKEVSIEDEQRYRELLTLRKKRIPLQHLTKTQCFMGLDFFVNENVLIPRMDTELLVEEIMPHLHDGMKILDVCTGSGCILLSLLHYSNDTMGIGIDISPKALEVANANREKLSMKKRAYLLESDLFQAFENQTEAALEVLKQIDCEDGLFEIMVSNPPYIRSDVIQTLMPEVKDYEPVIALDGMEDGLQFYREIIAKSQTYLKKGGKLFFEIGYDQKEEVCELMKQAGFKEVECKKDYSGLDRIVFGTYY